MNDVMGLALARDGQLLGWAAAPTTPPAVWKTLFARVMLHPAPARRVGGFLWAMQPWGPVTAIGLSSGVGLGPLDALLSEAERIFAAHSVSNLTLFFAEVNAVILAAYIALSCGDQPEYRPTMSLASAKTPALLRAEDGFSCYLKERLFFIARKTHIERREAVGDFLVESRDSISEVMLQLGAEWSQKAVFSPVEALKESPSAAGSVWTGALPVGSSRLGSYAVLQGVITRGVMPFIISYRLAAQRAELRITFHAALLPSLSHIELTLSVDDHTHSATVTSSLLGEMRGPTYFSRLTSASLHQDFRFWYHLSASARYSALNCRAELSSGLPLGLEAGLRDSTSKQWRVPARSLAVDYTLDFKDDESARTH